MAGSGYGTPVDTGSTPPPSSSGGRRQYCTTEDVKKYLPPNIRTEDDVPMTPNPMNPNQETITTINVGEWIDQACIRIDAALATIYDVPLKKTNEGGVVGYPSPVPVVAAILTSQMIFEQRLQGADRARSESQKEREKWAETQLKMIQNGELRLQGQRSTRGSRFVRGTLPNIPKNPAEGGRTKGE